jgi:phosphohistidine phosphatase
MKAKAYLPDLVLSSTSSRTKETLERVAKAAGMALKARFEDTLYLAETEEIFRVVSEIEDSAASALLVGHNPGMHHIALMLSEVSESPLRKALELKYPTCALSVLQFKVERWKDILPAEGRLMDFMAPGDL